MILKDFIKEKIYLLDDPKTVLDFFSDSKAYLNPYSQVQLSSQLLKPANIQIDWDLAIKGSQFDAYKVLPNYDTAAGLDRALEQLFDIKELQLVHPVDIGAGIASIAEEYELIYATDVLDSSVFANRIKITLENMYYGDLVSLWFKVSFINSKTNEEAMNFIISVDELQKSFKEDIVTLIPDYVVLYNKVNLDKAIAKIKNVIIAIITEAQNQ